MIYLTNGNIPLNAAYADEIVQEDNSTYQLSFRFPTSDSLWEQLKEEAFLTADDLHGEQDFVIFEVEKKHGYIQVYAKQVFTLLNNYVVSSLTLDQATGSTALSRFAGAITRDNPFSFFSDIEDRHTFNIGSKNAMEAFAKDKHSIIGQWGGDLVRHGYQVRLLKNGGSENESLFMYKKNLSSYQHKTSTKSLKTRITFIATVKGEGEKAPDRKLSVVVDSPLINKYSQIYEDVIEVNDRDVKDEASLRKYGEQYYRTSLCDMMEDSLELEIVDQSDVPVQMFDIVSLFHDVYNLDVRKKITKYTYSPIGKKLKTIGFGQFKSGLANAIGNAVSDAVKGEAQQLQSNFERQLARELKNADLAFDRQKEELVNQFTDGLNAAKARAEEVKRELSDTINQRFDSFDNASIQEAKRRAEEALRNAGASSLLAQEAKRISLDSIAKLEAFKSQATSAQTALSGDLDALKRTVTSEVNQSSEYRRTTTEALSRMTDQMNGFATKSEVRQDVAGLTETFAKLKTDTNNLISGAKSEITLAKTEFKKTADGLSAKMSAVESYVGQDGQRQEALRRYTREESARQVSTVREQISRDYVGKSAYQEDVRGLERRFSAISTQTNNDMATKIAQYKQTVDGQFASITSQMAGKVNQTDFQQVRETSQLYERIIGSNENDISNKVARMALTNQLFQVEVSKYTSQGGPNLVKNSGNPQDNKNWGYWEIGQTPKLNVASHSFFYNEKRKLFSLANNTKTGVPASTIRFSLKRNTSYTVSLTAFNTWNMKGATIYFLGRKSGENQTFTRTEVLVENTKFSTVEAVRKNYTFNSGECDEGFIRIDNNGTTNSDVAILLFGDVDVYEGTVTRPWQPSPEDDNEAVRSVQSQLDGSWAVQNLTSAGSIVSQINATNNQILIEAEKIRLKGKTLLDELTAFQGYFKRLFVGEGAFAKLNAEIIGSKTITADKLIMDQAMARLFVSSNIFTDMLTAKEAFINKLRSVVVSATLLEGYKGKIGGFQIGTHDKDPNSYWLTGQNQFAVGMGSGNGRGGQTALWVNWGNNWEKPSDRAWYVKNNGEMNCYNTAHFWNTPVVHGELRVTGYIYYDNRPSGGKFGFWISSPSYLEIDRYGDSLYLYKPDKTYDWILLNKDVSDRRYKTNIEDSKISGLDIIQKLKTYSYRKEYDGTTTDISCGIMAQDVQKYIPEAFFENPDGAYSYRTFELVPYLIKAIQELNQKLEEIA